MYVMSVQPYQPDHPPMNIAHPNYLYPDYYLIVPQGGQNIVPVPSPDMYNHASNDTKIYGTDGSVSKLNIHNYNLGLNDSHYLHFPFNEAYQGDRPQSKFYLRKLPKNVLLYKGRRVNNGKQFQSIFDTETNDNTHNQWFADFFVSLLYTNPEHPYQFVYRVQKDLYLFDVSDVYAVTELVNRIYKKIQIFNQNLSQEKNVAMIDQEDVYELKKLYKYMTLVTLALGQTLLAQKDKISFIQQDLPELMAKAYDNTNMGNYIKGLVDQLMPNIPVIDFKKSKTNPLPPVHADVFLEAKSFYHGFGRHPQFLSRMSITNFDNDMVDCIREFFPECDGYIGGPMLTLNKKNGNIFHPEICLFGNVRKSNSNSNSSSRRKLQVIKVLSKDNAFVDDPRMAIPKDKLDVFQSFYMTVLKTKNTEILSMGKKIISDILDENLKASPEQNGSGISTVTSILPSMYSRRMPLESSRLRRNPLYFTPEQVDAQYAKLLDKHKNAWQDKNYDTPQDAEKWQKESHKATQKMKIKDFEKVFAFQ